MRVLDPVSELDSSSNRIAATEAVRMSSCRRTSLRKADFALIGLHQEQGRGLQRERQGNTRRAPA